jgi:short-subunit dehydrogenase
MEVGPLSTMSEEAFRAALDGNLWTTIRVTLAAIPHLTSNGRIVNITSIGAAISVPHLLPYSVSKFGALGFSLGLEAELSGRGISVTSVLPGVMRTGSAIHARFRGDVKREFEWFSASAALPLLAIPAERAAKAIVSASLRRKRFVVLGLPAKVLRIAQALFPNLTLATLRYVGQLLPRPKGLPEQKAVVGKELKRRSPRAPLRRQGHRKTGHA